MSQIDDDSSANTARFRAFAERKDDGLSEPWQTPDSGSKTRLYVGIVIVLAVLAGVIAYLLA
jgi:type VI protein secretion system component VasF